MGCTQEQPVVCRLHFRTGLLRAHSFQLHYQQVEFQDELPEVFVLPHVDVDLTGRVDDELHIRGLVADDFLDVFLRSQTAVLGGDAFNFP